MPNRIWIVNYYAGTPEHCGNPRYLELAKAFVQAGYEVTIINSSVTENIDPKSGYVDKMYEDYHFIHVPAPTFVGNGLKRMYSIGRFAMNVGKLPKKIGKPDVILHNLHTPFDCPIYWIARRCGARYIAEAWDLWPEAFVRFGLISRANAFMKVAYRIERFLYEKADAVIFTLEGGIDYLKEKGWTTDKGGKIDPQKVHYINNGINLEEFERNVLAHPREDADMNDSSFYKIVYLGSVRLVNNVKLLIDAANILKSNPKYRFFVYGDGTDRAMLEQYVRENDINNVVFKEKRILLAECAWVVRQATVNVMNYQKGFGSRGASSGKMFQYFAAGKPICCNVKLNYSEITRRNLGIDRELDTPEQYAEAIRSLAEQPEEEYEAMCQRVRKAAEDFDYKKLAARELEVIESLE